MKKLIALLLLLLLPLLPALAEQAAPKGYVYITAGTEGKWFPLAEAEPYEITVRMLDHEGKLQENVICITTEGAYMHSSNCDNQDCVGQGVVTLENKDLRILGNWIICLPHQLSVELFTAEEALALTTAQ